MTYCEQGSLGLTRQLAQIVRRYPEASLPETAITVARQCIIDWFAVTLPGSREECSVLLAEELESEGAGPAQSSGARADCRRTMPRWSMVPPRTPSISTT